MSAATVHRNVYLGGLALAMAVLPWSEFLLSNALIILLVNWLWEGIATRNLAQRWRQVRKRPGAIWWLAFFALHLLGLAWSEDLVWGLDLCRILLPIPLLAVVVAGSAPLEGRQLDRLLLLGAVSAVASTVVCVALRPDAFWSGDHRALSPFISHIRLALMLCLAVVVLLHQQPRGPVQHVARTLAVLWAVFFLVWAGGITGWMILPLLLLQLLWRKAATVRWARPALVLGTAAVLIAGGLCVRHAWQQYFRVTDSLVGLDTHTAGGEMYFHDLERPQRENGHYVWIHIADEEMRRVWDRRAQRRFDGVDALGRPMKGTLVRYLASLGLRKDSLGVTALSAADVLRIEAGVESAVAQRGGPLLGRLHKVFHEVENYAETGDASGHSVMLRWEFLRTGLHVIARHPWVGVGTGDTRLAFDAAYERMDSRLAPEWRLRAHDQYITWAVSFGILGALFCLATWIIPAWRARGSLHPLFGAWALIVLLSCLTDDTLETQMGATFAALYYALFVFGVPLNDRSASARVPERSA